MSAKVRSPEVNTARHPLRIALIDYIVEGHHAPYAMEIAAHLHRNGHEVMAVGPPSWCVALRDFAAAVPVDYSAPSSKDYFARQTLHAQFFARALSAAAAARVQVAHVMYLDGSIDALRLASIPVGLRVLATMHWYPFLHADLRSPRTLVRASHAMLALRRLSNGGVSLVVHAQVARRRLAALGLREVFVVDYPNVVPQTSVDISARAEARSRLGVADVDRLLLCFGGTRLDKGADLAIAALSAADPDLKLLIAGAAQDFDQAALQRLANATGVGGQLLLRLGHVDDAEMFELFCAADAVLLPYRPMFSGQSGPLVIAGAMGVPIVAADVPVLAETLRGFRLGRLFRAGSIPSLSAALRGPLPQVAEADHARFASASSPRHFGSRHEAIYRRVTGVSGDAFAATMMDSNPQ